jgi:hypothetical protein
MTDPPSSMSLTAVLLLTLVVLVTMALWLGTVFFVGREPRSGGTRPGEVDPGQTLHPEASRHRDPGDAPAGPARRPGGDGTAAQAGHSPAPAGRASGGHG